MVLLTRSAAKKASEEASAPDTRPQATPPGREGTVVTVQTSATGLGVHKRWHYPEVTRNLNHHRGTNVSFSSCSSLSSLSDSDEESNHSGIGSMSSLSTLSSSTSSLHIGNKAQLAPPETPVRPTRNDASHRRSPLKRSPLIRWINDGATDRFVACARGFSDEHSRMREEVKAQKLEEVFETQYAVMMRQREMALLTLQSLENGDDDVDIDIDVDEPHDREYALRHLVRGDTEPLIESPKSFNIELDDPFELDGGQR